jgi:hypothetical protein
MITQPKIVGSQDGKFYLVFDDGKAAIDFIRKQSPNAPWRAQWTFRECENGNWIAECDSGATHVTL